MSSPTSAKGVTVSSESSIPKGWTDNIYQETTIKEMINESTGLTVDKVDLAEIAGSRYVFSSGENLYLYNCSSQEGAVVKSPRGRDALFAQMAANTTPSVFSNVVLEALVVPDSDSEG
ncbi:hypothetical protein BS17DRAFT_789092 [Gyrodon lividus]|nr:hypothetical protein BS17DRAFT_789092 [Gyrodon lividus]